LVGLNIVEHDRYPNTSKEADVFLVPESAERPPRLLLAEAIEVAREITAPRLAITTGDSS